MPSIVEGGVTGTSVFSNTYVAGAQGHTRDMTAPMPQRKQGRSGMETKIEQGMETRENPSRTLTKGSKVFSEPLPTPINVNSLERVLSDHPDHLFVSRLYYNLKYGASVGYIGPRPPRFSRNLPTALEQPSVVTAILMKEVPLGYVAGPFPTPPPPCSQIFKFPPSV